MRRVHRNLDANQTAELRQALSAQLPASDLPIGEVIRNMRLSIKRSQSEYAQLCGVSARLLAAIEIGEANPTLKTLQALLLPFACDVGVVRLSDAELRKRRAARVTSPRTPD
jgi:transcriptional regulator with XRE-family HTH domain